MRLYLVQHGEALAKDEDPDRPLSPGGRADMGRMGGFLARARVRPERILHSGKTRARQSAELLADALQVPGEVEYRDGLEPNDPVEPLSLACGRWHEDTLLVGHLPLMAQLTARLVMGDEGTPVCNFHPGTVVCLERSETAHWALAWMVRPHLLAAGSPGAG